MYNLTELLIFFDEIDPLTNEDIKQYWLSSKVDQNKILLSFSEYERKINILIDILGKEEAFSCSFNRFKEIKVLDLDRKILEITFDEELCLRVLINLSSKGSIICINH